MSFEATRRCSASPFAYILSEKAPLYRTIMRLFIESKERFVLSLHPQDVLDAVPLPPGELDSALAQLCEWGNLETRPDTAHVRTVEDFITPRQTFRITNQGEAAERALAQVHIAPEERELQCRSLADIRHVIQELKQLSREAQPDAGKVRRCLMVLRVSFEDLTATAHVFINKLEQRVQVHSPDDASQLIDFGERFIGELVLASDSIGATVREIEAGFERLLQEEWRSHWQAFCSWFISQPGRLSNAELLRERARTLMPALLAAITDMKDRSTRRIDRSNDFRVLARWFAEAESDAEAHRLWRTVFGLCPARHLTINDEALDDHASRVVPANISWLDAPTFRIYMHVRNWAGNSEKRTLTRIIDRTAEKEKLAAATREEALRILDAQRRFGTGRRMRLSELEHLEPVEFDLFLDVLGEAVSARVSSTEAVEILSGDGRLRIKLEPTDDGREALILTTEGAFSGPDHWISIEQISAEEEVLEVLI